jgi:hypothetical protein
VFEGGLVEDEDVGEGRNDKVDCCAGKPGEGSEAESRSLWGEPYHVMKNKLSVCRYMLSLVHWLIHAASPGGKDRILLAGCH